MHPLDFDKPITVTRQQLPHWTQQHVTYFVNFRLADSVPAPLLRSWEEQRTIWLRVHGITYDSENQWRHKLQTLPEALRREFRTRFTQTFERMLDDGHGSCLLRNPESRNVVENALRYFHNERYTLGRFVIMPNHVHALICPQGEHALKDILHSWKRFTARKINEALGRKGELWQSESYDHIVRDEAELQRIENYILQNPLKAGLQDGFTLG
ncbi:transposase [Phragmitibacter flavus]|uniref:transposase n=1 Tax=Phragmitibacter flavus TaxID=2576071 RepID=UPI00140B9728|nr:transposase [Phragmitibacter flavus]